MKHAAAAFALVLAAVAPAAPACAQDAAPVTLAQARASTAGQWRGQLQYLDYQSGEWQGIPVTVDNTVGGDGNTMIRIAAFDDGPRVGLVYVTSLTMLDRDGTTEFTTGFRAGRTPEVTAYAVSLAAAADAEHWTMLAEIAGEDNNRPARIRETTTRDGARIITLKEVDFLDEPGEQWFSRNRTVLEQTGG
jgi:hypothetical protein